MKFEIVEGPDKGEILSEHETYEQANQERNRLIKVFRAMRNNGEKVRPFINLRIRKNKENKK